MHQLALKIGNYTDEEVKAIIADLEDLLLSLELAIDVLSARIAAIASSGGELSDPNYKRSGRCPNGAVSYETGSPGGVRSG